MNIFTFATTVLSALYLLAIIERLTCPVIEEDGQPVALDNYSEMEWENTRDYYTAADHGYGHESSWDF